MSIRIVRGEDIHHERSHLTAATTKLLVAEPLILDTETTGLGDEAEICEIAVLRHDGSVVLDTLVRPTGKIPADATRVHGITDADVRDAPSIDDVLDARVRLFLSSHPIAIYNADYDLRLLRQSAAAAGDSNLNIWAMGMGREAFCVMEDFASGTDLGIRSTGRTHGRNWRLQHFISACRGMARHIARSRTRA